MRLTLSILLASLLLAPPCQAGITFHGANGQTLYARVQIGASTFESVGLNEGSSGGLGVYFVDDAALVSAGVDVAGNLPYTIRSGSPSDTANDTIVGSGVLPWSGSVELPAAANISHLLGTAWITPATAGRPDVNVGWISGGSAAADELEETFDNDGTGGDVDVAGLNVTAGVTINNSTTNGAGISITGNDAPGIRAIGNIGLSAVGENGPGISAIGNGVSGSGFRATSNDSGAGILAEGASGPGISALGDDDGAGLLASGGATGVGVSIAGGSTSGNGINVTTTDGQGVEIYADGTDKDAVNIDCYDGNGIRVNSPQKSAVAISSETGSAVSMASVDNCGLRISTEDGDSAVEILTSSEGTGNGLAITGGTGGDAVRLQGTGSGRGLYSAGGATGIGAAIAGGATSGDGVSVTTNLGHGIIATAGGTSKHGTVLTGGTNGDGFRAVAGSGGIAIRGDIFGSLSGTIGGLSTGALADLFDTDSGKLFSNAVSGSVVKEIADHATTPSLSTAGIADAVLDELLSGHVTPGSLSAVIADIFDFLDGSTLR